MKKIIFVGLCFFLLSSCNRATTDEKFVGKWLIFSDIPKKNTEGVNHSNGYITSINKIENTSESYSLFFLGSTETFTKKDENTLTGVSENWKLTYIDSTQHIILLLDNNTGWEFSRLK